MMSHWDQTSVSSFELRGVPAEGCGTRYGRQGKSIWGLTGFIKACLGEEPKAGKGRVIWEEKSMGNRGMRE